MLIKDFVNIRIATVELPSDPTKKYFDIKNGNGRKFRVNKQTRQA